MKSFKGYLQEKFQDWKSGSAPAWTESLSTMLFDLPRAGFKDIHIPLSPSIMSRIWPKSVRSKAFHLTDFGHTLLMIEGDKGMCISFNPALGRSNNIVDKLSVHAGADPLFQSWNFSCKYPLNDFISSIYDP